MYTITVESDDPRETLRAAAMLILSGLDIAVRDSDDRLVELSETSALVSELVRAATGQPAPPLLLRLIPAPAHGA